MDNAEPSANGISAQNLYRLGSMLEDESYSERARQTCIAFEGEMSEHPFLFTSMLPAVVAGELGVKSVVLAGQDSPELENAAATLRNKVSGALTTMVRCCEGDGDRRSKWLRERNPVVRELHGDRARVMVCEAGACRENSELLNNKST